MGSPKPAPFNVKANALEAIGFIGCEPDDKESRTLEWIWQLSMQEPQTWKYLAEFMDLWTAGKHLSQKASLGKQLAKERAGNAVVVTQGALSPKSKATGRQPKKKQKRMPSSAMENAASVQQSTPKIVDIPGKKEWDPFTGMNSWDCDEGGDGSTAEYKRELFKALAENTMTLADAGQKAKIFKGQCEAKNDFINGLDDISTWAEAKSKYPHLTTDSAMEAAARDYMVPSNKKVASTKKKGKKITLQMANMISRAKAMKDAVETAQSGTDAQCLRLERQIPLTEEQKAAGMKTHMIYECLQGDATKMIEENKVQKRPYRFAFIDVPYEEWSDDMFDSCMRDLVILMDCEYTTVLCMCGEGERDRFAKIADTYFDSLEFVYWYKPNAMVSGLNRHAKQIEVGFIAYKCTAEGSEGKRPATIFFDWNATERCGTYDDKGELIEGSTQDSDQLAMNSNVFEFRKVRSRS